MFLRKKKTTKLDEGWRAKVDIHGISTIAFWEAGNIEQPEEIHCFISLNEKLDENSRKKIEDLGVKINNITDTIRTATIPTKNMKKFAELDIVKSITFPKKLYLHED